MTALSTRITRVIDNDTSLQTGIGDHRTVPIDATHLCKPN